MKYIDSYYHKILDANKKSIDMKIEYANSQPEFKEQAFLNQLHESINQEKLDKHNKMIWTWELGKYRINKKFPATLAFETRKKLFIESSEFNSRIRQQNKHLSASEITEENIQSEIDEAGILMGMELEQQFDSMKIEKAVVEGYCELVIDKGDVKYK